MPSMEIPEDVFREIFESALAEGALSREWKADCCRFALVSKPIQLIVEPMLYREIDITSEHCCEVMDRTIQHHPAKPSGFFAHNVKTIRVRYIVEEAGFVDALRRILVACKGIQKYENTLEVMDSIAGTIFGYRYRSESLVHTIPDSVPPPKHLTIHEHSFAPSALRFNQGIFTNVTHLCLWGASEWDWRTLSTLRRLTHLKVQLRKFEPMAALSLLHIIWQVPDTEGEDEILQQFVAALNGLTPLQLVILDRVYKEELALEEEIRRLAEADMRIVVRGNISCEEQDGPWVFQYVIPHESQPLELLWELGEAHVERRRQGSVKWPPPQP